MKNHSIFIIIAAIVCLLMPSQPIASENVHTAKSGIIICGDSGNVRALEPFIAKAGSGAWYSEAINQYRKALKSDVNIYSIVIPTAIEYYCPAEMKNKYSAERPIIDNIYKNLIQGITPIDVHTTLRSHIDEPIYSRTDHHWSPLGAYYAAEAFANTAKVPFAELSQYNKAVVNNFVGSMYYYSGDISLKKSPEQFIYYMPKKQDYKTTYIGHNLGKGRKVIGITEPFEDNFFIKYKDGSSSAYCTFMGGDTRTTHVATATNNGRRLLIIKDSYGNALPGYLFHSFEDIYVVDFRYFTKNIVTYINDNNITDVLFANNLQHAYSASTSNKLINMLHK